MHGGPYSLPSTSKQMISKGLRLKEKEASEDIEWTTSVNEIS